MNAPLKAFVRMLHSGRMAAFLMLASPLAALTVHGDPLDQWSGVSSGVTNQLNSIVYGDNQFVAVGSAGMILTSSNALTWSPAASGVTNSLQGVAFGNGQFVAVGIAGVIITSGDGANWSKQNSGTLNQLTAVAYTPPGFVAVGRSATILTSTNGTNWIARSSGATADFVGVGSGFGQVYAGDDGNSPSLFYSADAATWYSLSGVPGYLQPQLFNGGFAYGNGAVVGIEARGHFAWSGDGINWTNYGSGGQIVYAFGLVFARNEFVAVGGNVQSPGRAIVSSTNGVAWQARYSESSEGRLLGVAYGSYRFVAVGDGGSILVSDPLLWFSNPSTIAGMPHATLNGEAGAIYHIQAATNLSQPMWVNVGTVTNISEAQDVLLPVQGADSSAFYRATTQ